MTSTPRRDPYRLINEIFGGRYRLEEFAGAGSFGAVYRAIDTRLDRTVAVKILKPDIKEAEAASARELFRREALTAGRLVHPHIVAVTDAGEEADMAYLIIEWLEGRTLDAELKSCAPLSPERTNLLLAPISDALQTAHDKGVIHRDIKPSNIHLGRYGRTYVKVLDFGIAKVVTTTSAAEASRIAGTLSYMAPEQLTGGHIDRRTDIYALGIMLYQMLSGKLPFTGETQGQVIQQQLSGPAPSLIDIRPDISPEISQVVQRALSKRPEDRQQSVQELHTEFTEALQSASIATRDRMATTPLQGPTEIGPPPSPQTYRNSPPPYTHRQAQQTNFNQHVPYQTPRDEATVVSAPHNTARGPSRETVVAADASHGPNTGPVPNPLANLKGSSSDNLKTMSRFALIGSLITFVSSLAVSLFSRSMGFTRYPYYYDEYVLYAMNIALRDAIFGALLSIALAELRMSRPHWSVANGQLVRALLVHGSLGAAVLMSPFVLLRTSLFVLPVTLAIFGFVAGLMVWLVRLAAHKLDTRP